MPKVKQKRAVIHDSDDDDEVFIDESQSVLPPTKKIKLDRKPSLVTKMKTKPRPDSMKSKTSVRTRGENGATTSGESGSMTSGETGSMMNNDGVEFQEAQEIPNEDFDYVLPPAPEPVQREIIDEKDVLLMAPRPVVAYRLGFGNKFLCLVAQQGVLVAKLVDTVERRGFPVPNGEKIIKLEAMEMAGLDYFLPEFRATMHDDGPMYGEKTKHVGGLHFMGLNSQYGEALDIRSFFRRLPTAKPSASRKGVRLSNPGSGRHGLDNADCEGWVVSARRDSAAVLCATRSPANRNQEMPVLFSWRSTGLDNFWTKISCIFMCVDFFYCKKCFVTR